MKRNLPTVRKNKTYMIIMILLPLLIYSSFTTVAAQVSEIETIEYHEKPVVVPEDWTSDVDSDESDGSEDTASETLEDENIATELTPENNLNDHIDPEENTSPFQPDPPIVSEEGMQLEEFFTMETPFYASTGEELIALLKENTGGVIYATNDLILEDLGDVQSIQANIPVIVDMGPYTLWICEDLYIVGTICFMGSGTVLRLKEECRLYTNKEIQIHAEGNGAIAVWLEQDSGWNTGQASITANGIGATALKIEDTTLALMYAKIEANGAGCIGIQAESSIIIFESTIEVHGSNSIGISITGDTTIYCSSVEAWGTNSIGMHISGETELIASRVVAAHTSILTNRKITLDCSYANPALPNAIILPRTASYTIRYWTEVGLPVNLDDEIRLELIGTHGGIKTTIFAPVSWEKSKVNTDRPGEYPVTATVLPEFADRWPIIEYPTFTGSVHVLYDGDIFIYSVATIPSKVRLKLHQPFQEGDVVSVQIREEGSSDWKVVDGSRVQIEPSTVTVQFPIAKQGILHDFQLHVLRDGETLLSNVVSATPGNASGDRGGDDRNPVGKRPETIIWDNNQLLIPQNPEPISIAAHTASIDTQNYDADLPISLLESTEAAALRTKEKENSVTRAHTFPITPTAFAEPSDLQLASHILNPIAVNKPIDTAQLDSTKKQVQSLHRWSWLLFAGIVAALFLALYPVRTSRRR